uniref:Transmembrane protein n=1 Tax=Opuntia streptacantha TaxID=393608 RepID=A0A7C9ESV7_OPUST
MGDTWFWADDAAFWFDCRCFERLFWPLNFSLRTEILDYFCSHFVRTNGWSLAVCFARLRLCCSSIMILCILFFSHLSVIISRLLSRAVYCVWIPVCVVVELQQVFATLQPVLLCSDICLVCKLL